MITHTTCLCLALLAAQDGSAQSTSNASDDGWKDLDRVAMIINEEIITDREITKVLNRVRNAQPINSRAALQQAIGEIGGEQVRQKLWVQAGQDLGVEGAQIERLVDDQLDRLKERHEGAAGFSAFLQSQDLDQNQARDQLRQDIYGDVWERYVSGDGPAPGRRPSVDTYVRPGAYRFRYEQIVTEVTGAPSELARIGGRPPQIAFQLLILDPKQAPDVAEARKLADSLRARIEAGEDMTKLIQQYGVKMRNDGLIDKVDEERLAQMDRELGTFVRAAQPGQLSEVLPYKNDEVSTWRIVRLVERSDVDVPDLDRASVQKKLDEVIRADLREYRKEASFQRLLRTSYVWPPQLTKR
ncbi:MAG: peptidylprolyl isomerase [Planctomycetota bacterium]